MPAQGDVMERGGRLSAGVAVRAFCQDYRALCRTAREGDSAVMNSVATGAAGDLVSAGTIHDHRRGRVALLSPSSPRRSTYRHAASGQGYRLDSIRDGRGV